MHSSKYFIRFFPILLISVGILIHALGLLGIEYRHAPFWLHVIMLFVDSIAFIGLWIATSWGWWLAVLLFIQQIIFQTYWSLQNPDPIFFPVPLLCLGALIIMAMNRHKISN